MEVSIDNRRRRQDVERPKRSARESPYEDEFVPRDEVSVKKSRSGDHRDKRVKKGRSGIESGSCDDDASGSEAELSKILVKQQQKQFSIFKTEKVNKKFVPSDKVLPESGDGLRNHGGGRTPALVERKPLKVNGSEKPNKNKEYVSQMCHQCQRNDKDGVVFCSKCERKRYCYQCIANW